MSPRRLSPRRRLRACERPGRAASIPPFDVSAIVSRSRALGQAPAFHERNGNRPRSEENERWVPPVVKWRGGQRATARSIPAPLRPGSLDDRRSPRRMSSRPKRRYKRGAAARTSISRWEGDPVRPPTATRWRRTTASAGRSRGRCLGRFRGRPSGRCERTSRRPSSHCPSDRGSRPSRRACSTGS